MFSTPADRRETERLRLTRPILGSVDGAGALILDIGFAGVLVEHYGAFQRGETFQIMLIWEGHRISYGCEVAHSTVVRTASTGAAVSHTGARLVTPADGSDARLRKMMASLISKVVEAQKANAQAESSDGGAYLRHLGDARRIRTLGYVVYRYRDGAWSHTPSDYPLQPQNGFTVAAYEDEEELRLLCDAYASADEAGRMLIRMVAELSARSARLPV